MYRCRQLYLSRDQRWRHLGAGDGDDHGRRAAAAHRRRGQRQRWLWQQQQPDYLEPVRWGRNQCCRRHAGRPRYRNRQRHGTITYTPAAGYTGADSFTYRATNAGGTSPIPRRRRR
ncbi:Ig-like domain-containing protein [Jeongeupia sp. HS-3]|uniref:Ig-like domain-containing protein n=1 Tax=Jeongeupia sp. HS-3 TaxID=1009682 RepID=UPI0035B5F8D2